MPKENFIQQAIRTVKAERLASRKRSGKAEPKPTNPILEFYKERGINPRDLR